MNIDLGTLHLSSLLGRAAYLGVFMLVAARQPQEVCLRHWIAAIFASLAGSAMMVVIPPDRWFTPGEALAVYTSYSASLTLSWSGLRLFNGRAVHLPKVAAMTLAPGIFYIFALAFGIPQRSALACVLLFCVTYAAMGALEAVNRRGERPIWSAYVVSATLGVYALMLLATFGVLVFTDMPMNTSESARMSMIVDQATGILIYFSYIAMAKEQAVLTIERLAETDALTGLGNRRSLERAVAGLDQARGDNRAGVLLADIDKFKMINDTHGHQAGDAVLVAFAARMRGALREGDIVVRWGGEEFLAVLLPVIDDALLMSIAERLRRVVEATPFELPDGGTIAITVSIGLSTMPMRAEAFEPTARQADAALYDAKAAGRNRIRKAAPAPLSTFSETAIHAMRTA